MSRRLVVVGERASYHVVSRVVDRRFVMGEEEKAEFRRLMGELVGFSGVELLTYCLMSNHFHLLVVVPEADSAREEMGDAEFFERLAHLYPEEEVARVRARLEELHRESPPRAEVFRWRYLRRMFSLPVFVQELKRRFSRWYNRRADRRGVLWEERYRSVLVEKGRALAAVAAYIDLNPVRAGLEGRPGRYRWSGFGEAERGKREARRGLGRVMDQDQGGAGRGWREVREAYWGMLALLRPPGAGGGSAGRSVKALTAGLAVGGREFLEGVFRAHRELFGLRRRMGARRIRAGGEPGGGRRASGWEGIGALREFR